MEILIAVAALIVCLVILYFVGVSEYIDTSSSDGGK
jgi:hypothetical protein